MKARFSLDSLGDINVKSNTVITERSGRGSAVDGGAAIVTKNSVNVDISYSKAFLGCSIEPYVAGFCRTAGSDCNDTGASRSIFQCEVASKIRACWISEIRVSIDKEIGTKYEHVVLLHRYEVDP